MDNRFDQQPGMEETPQVPQDSIDSQPEQASASQTTQPQTSQPDVTRSSGSQNVYSQYYYAQSAGDHSANRSYEPTQSQYTGAYQTQSPSYQQTAEPKKSRRGLKIAAAALALVLVGGAVGGAVTGTVINRKQTQEEGPALQAQLADILDEAQAQKDAEAAAETAEESAPAAAQEAAEDSSKNTAPSGKASSAVALTAGQTVTELTPAQVYEKCVSSVVSIANSSTSTNVFGQASSTASSGSGFIVSADGYIITNYHVIEDANTLTVTLTSGEEYEATVIGTEEDGDIALIKIDATGLTPVSVGNSDNLAVGQQVVAIGNPLGELTNTLTVGYISALDREIAVESGTDLNVLQTDCAINPGNSGGPLFDLYGNVIGITTAKYSSSSVEGIGFVIPINDVAAIIGDLTQYGYVTGKPWLGVTLKNLSEDVTAYYGLSGIYVYSITETGPADQAGLQTGDIITALNDTKVTTSTELTTAMKNYRAGDTVTLSVLRDGETKTLSVTLGDKHEGEELVTAQQEAAQQQQQEQQEQQQSGSGSYSWPSGMEDWFNYFYGSGR